MAHDPHTPCAEAIPDDALSKVAGPDAHPVARRHAMWSDQNARGVIPDHVCSSPGGVIDLRGNNLVGSVPACVWAQANGGAGRDVSLTPVLKALGFNSFKVYHFQAIGFNVNLHPYTTARPGCSSRATRSPAPSGGSERTSR